MWLQPSASSSHPKPRSRPVLIVDDDEDIRNALREILPTWGYSVIGAADGYEAMTFAREFTPATIILDLFMPKMNGFLFRRWQLAQPNLANVPVIVLTAAGSAGADLLSDVTALYKPVDFDLLHAFLDVHVRPGD